MTALWADLLGCLELDADRDADTFVGRNQQLEYHRVFGGQLLAQFLRIAALTCPDKSVKSQHAIFAREGRADEPIRYEAVRNHDGRSFAALTITARQSRGVVATSSISMHTVEGGPEHQEVEDVPAVLGPEHEVALDLIPFQTRAAVDLNATTTGPPQFEFWMRTPPVTPDLAPHCDRSTVPASEATARPSPLPSPPTPCGSTGRFAPTAGYCYASTVPFWPTGGASGEATCSPRTASWSPRTRRKHSFALGSPHEHEKHVLLVGESKWPKSESCVDTSVPPMPEL